MLSLLKKRSFGAFTLAQFLGAFNDNAFKGLIILLVTYMKAGDDASAIFADSYWANQAGTALPAALFALPFIVLGPITGSLADKLSKTTVIRFAKLMELVVMAGGTVALAMRSYDGLLLVTLMMGVQSAIFGPSKYGVIKELVGAKDLSRANALIQASTMVAILAGMVISGYAADLESAYWTAGLFYMLIALVGWFAALAMAPLPAISPDRKVTLNPVNEFIHHWKATQGRRELVLAICASAWFYMLAAVFMLGINEYGAWLDLKPSVTAWLNAYTIVGIVVGAVLASQISGDRVEGGLIPVGLGLMAIATLILQVDPDSARLLRGALFVIGVGSGLFTVPIRSLIQGLPAQEHRGSVQGLAETMDFIGIGLAGGLTYLLAEALDLSPPIQFLVGGALVAFAAVVSVIVAGEYLVRVVLLVLSHTVYRLRSHHLSRVPEEGGALLVANHVSFADAVLVAAAVRRPVRFLMHRDLFALPLVGWFARRMGAIPVSSSDTKEGKRASLALAAEAIREGSLVCIFAEGAITRTGSLLGFASGLERIAADAKAPIVPVALDRVWGSIWSFAGGKALWKMPRLWRRPIDVGFGEPLPYTAKAPEVRQAIAEEIADMRLSRKGRRGSLAWRFLYTTKRHGRSDAVVDSSGTALNYRQVLTGSLALARVLRRHLDDTSNVGILLPQGPANLLANAALTLERRTAVHGNYTLDDATLKGCFERSGVRYVITSRRFLKVLEREAPVAADHALFVEDLLKDVGGADKAAAFLWTLLPSGWLAHLRSPQRSSDEIAAVLFSSGSSGTPKAVQLTHGAVLSNVQSSLQVLAFGPGDALLGVLPYFHAFGYTIGMWASALAGAKSCTHPDPLGTDAITKLCQEHACTAVIGTPTFFQTWLRRCPTEIFRAMRMCVCGAQRLPADLADAWREATGNELLEGYGATELGPVVACNVQAPEGTSPRHRGHQVGSVGRPLPGVVVRAVHPETRAVLTSGEEGLLEVKSPSMMVGYLGQDAETAEVLRDGWYVTGDIGRVEPDGFLVITDRLSRFSKIGGEMVPHGRVEETLRATLAAHLRDAGLEPGTDTDIAVTAIEDERRGEQLVVLCAQVPIPLADLANALNATDLPPLFRPKPVNFIEVDAIPQLASGKVDLGAIRRLAAERLG
tara:strand:- start:10645 stop:14094 length:3450 start_codon:yes stop_codon:yes gene_type:complete